MINTMSLSHTAAGSTSSATVSRSAQLNYHKKSLEQLSCVKKIIHAACDQKVCRDSFVHDRRLKCTFDRPLGLLNLEQVALYPRVMNSFITSRLFNDHTKYLVQPQLDASRRMDLSHSYHRPITYTAVSLQTDGQGR